ncbi:MAG: glycosyl transferase family 2 [Dokdonella sp.]
MQSSIAIIIPAGPGDEAWRGLLPQLAAVNAREIILVRPDGEPAIDVETQSPLREIRTQQGRARQLNVGAAASSADWLWFLHADSRLGATTAAALHGFIASDRSAIGYFTLRFSDDGPALTAINTFGTWWRCFLFGLPFGDQGYLMPRRVFESLGSFDEAQIGGEDHALIWSARKAGIPVQHIRAPIYTSARKYEDQGWGKTTRHHLALTWRQARQFSRSTVGGSEGS